VSARKRWIAALSGTGLLAFLLCWPWPVHSQVAAKTFTFTSPGDDANVGTATTYLLRYSTTRPDTTSATAKSAWWSTASVLTPPPPPTPLVAGTSQTITTGPSGGWTTGTTYYVVLRSLDDVGNLSDFSNVAVLLIPDTIPPSRVIDLRVN
jgi:hypothetical protein